MGSGDGLTLAERSAQARARAATAASAASAASAAPAGSATQPVPESERTRPVGRRHCWVVDLPDAPGRFAGVVLSWRHQVGQGWSARTVYVVDGADDAVLIEAWVPAQHLRPA